MYEMNAAYQQSYPTLSESVAYKRALTCDWKALRAQILLQWRKVTPRELDETGPSPSRIAQIIEGKYGIASPLVENYLYNVARTLPVM